MSRNFHPPLQILPPPAASQTLDRSIYSIEDNRPPPPPLSKGASEMRKPKYENRSTKTELRTDSGRHVQYTTYKIIACIELVSSPDTKFFARAKNLVWDETSIERALLRADITCAMHANIKQVKACLAIKLMYGSSFEGKAF